MSKNHKDARARLVSVLASPTDQMAAGLAAKKMRANELAARDDVLWYLLLQSMSTLQSSAGHQHIFPGAGKEPLPQITYAALKKLSEERREEVLTDAFAKVRYGTIKGIRLASNFEMIERMGGLGEATRIMRALRGADAKKSWVRRFHGIGEKYARNFWMDIRDADFNDSIAVDSRLMSVGKILGMDDTEYCGQERFFLGLAKEAGISGWEADRLIYGFREELLREAEIPVPWRTKGGDRHDRAPCAI